MATCPSSARCSRRIRETRRSGHRAAAMTEPRSEYARRIARWDEAIARGERTHLFVSNLRLAAAVIAAVLAWLGFIRNAISPGWALIPALSFLILLVIHARVLNRNDRAARARRFYERGLDRLEGRWSGHGPDGARFLDGHPYARDLDLFGPGSLFQLLDTARTESGEETLADWLREPAALEVVSARQAAVSELRERLDFREDLAILAAEAHVSRTTALAAWTRAGAVGLTRGAAVLFAICAALTAALVVAAIWGPVTAGPLLLWLGAQAGLVSFWRRRVHAVLRRVDAAANDLSLLVELLDRIEREPFSSPRLAVLREMLLTSGVTPAKRIAQLQFYIAARDSLRNEFVRPFAMLLLVRSQAAVAIDRWHAAHGRALGQWLSVVGELEALASLATYAFEHPADPFPAVHDGAPMFSAAALAHPLLPELVAVPNDVMLGAEAAHVLIVSGSNMSGKSTLLRAVGVNVVLALAGAPVRARSMALSPLAIGATIRVDDSLQEGHSRFYTEILRIRDVVALSRKATPVLFLLDEILHGTNSYDRRIGAEAIVRALVDAGSIGLVTTHDLALTELVASPGGKAKNVHFEDRIEQGRMVFDYRMRDGVVERSNALDLMRAVGLDV